MRSRARQRKELYCLEFPIKPLVIAFKAEAAFSLSAEMPRESAILRLRKVVRGTCGTARRDILSQNALSPNRVIDRILVRGKH